MSMAVGLSVLTGGALYWDGGISCHPSFSSVSTVPAVPAVGLVLGGFVFLEVGRRVGEVEELVEGGGTKCSEPIFSLHSPAENG